MPSWDQVRAEVAEALAAGPPSGTPPERFSPYDVVRRQKLADLSDYLDRPLIVYAVDCLTPSPKTNVVQQLLGPVATLLETGDRDAFSEVLEDVQGDRLAVLLQSPGGFAETVEALVGQIRGKFSDVAFIVPMYAKSAATMFALSGDELLLDEHSELGPIDPQFVFAQRPSPAQGILNQFEQAVKQIKEDPERLPAWVPILQQYAPSLLEDASEALDLATTMVAGWLEKHMFSDSDDAHDKADQVARFFSGRDPQHPMRSHLRPIRIEMVIQQGLRVNDIRVNPGLHQRVRELHHAINITFAETAAYKLVENHLEQAFIRSLNVEQVGTPPGAPPAAADASD